jgi:hypothetical protein
MEDELGEVYSTHRVDKNAAKILVGRPEGKIPLGRHGHGLESNGA